MSALNKIMAAGNDDPNAKHPLVLNYEAIMEDLLGEYDKAHKYLEELRHRTPLSDREVQAEIASNIGVVKQHQLRRLMVLQGAADHVPLGEAGQPRLEAQMADALTEVFPDGNKVWSAHRDALSARFLALQCIPRTAEDAEHDRQLRHELTQAYEKATVLAKSVLGRWAPAGNLTNPKAREGWRQARALAHNALGRAEMYHTDFFGQREEKVEHLATALTHLQHAQRAYDNDWAFTGDLGSCHMRLGHWRRAVNEYELARRQLTIVLEKQRPEWGFALFEMGRVYRLEGNLSDALRYLKRAEQVVLKDRDVSDDRVRREINLTNEKSKHYP